MKTSRVLISIFVVCHLWLMMVIPFQSKILRESLPSIFYSYTSFIGLNTPWNFFSPEPSPRAYFEVETYQDQLGDDEWKSFFWPPDRSKFFFRESFYRRLFSLKALYIKEERWPILADYFCRTKNASLVTLKLISHPVGLLIDSERTQKKYHDEKQFLCEDL